MDLNIRTSHSSELDLVSLGECMVRLSPPGHGRIEFAKQLDVWVGGGEYNVAYGLTRLGLRTGWVGALVDNPVGKIILNHARSAGMDVSDVIVMPYDGVGREARVGLNFGEVGIGPRASVTMYDRGHSATSKMTPGSVDWQTLFGRRGVRWLHTGGIFTCLSDSTRRVVTEGLEIAHNNGTVVSYDLNFRSQLWTSQEAIAATRPLMSHIDCLIGNEEDFQMVLGYEVQGTDAELKKLPIENYKKMVRQVSKDYPNLKIIATTLREVKSGLLNNWSAILYWSPEDRFYQGMQFNNLEIEDRVGGGDGFVSGFAYGQLTGKDLQTSVDLGTAHGALLQSTPGDTSQVTREDLEHVASGGTARIKR